MDLRPILDAVLEDPPLPWHGIHGLAHWGRVLDNGLRLAESTGADETVVTLFALFHDSRREDDGVDPDHGRRGAEFAMSLRGTCFEVTDRQAWLLHEACVYHADGHTEGDVTVRTCWDADRLDLPRTGIAVRPDRLCTDAARDYETIFWAAKRAMDDHISERIRDLHDELMRRAR